MEEDLRMMQNDLVGLKIANASLTSSVNHLADTVRALTETVQILRDTMNQGRGMMWLLMTAAGAMGAIAAVIIKRIIAFESAP